MSERKEEEREEEREENVFLDRKGGEEVEELENEADSEAAECG